MGLLDRLNQRLGATGQPAEDAGASAREEAQRAMERKRAEQERAADTAQGEVIHGAQKSAATNAQTASQGAQSTGKNSQTAGQGVQTTGKNSQTAGHGAQTTGKNSRTTGQGAQTTTAEAAAILAGKEPSRVAGGIFFFDADRMMVISEGGRFIQKQRAIRYDQLEAYALVQDGEMLAQNSVSTISDNRPAGDDPKNENCGAAGTKAAGASITDVKAADTKVAGASITNVKAADTRVAGASNTDMKAADMKAAGTKKHCLSLSVIMYIKDTSESSSGKPLEQIEIPFITTKTKIGGFLYRTNRTPADQLIEALDLVLAGCR